MGEIEENVSMLEHYDGKGKILCDILEYGRKFDVDCQGQKGWFERQVCRRILMAGRGW